MINHKDSAARESSSKVFRGIHNCNSSYSSRLIHLAETIIPPGDCKHLEKHPYQTVQLTEQDKILDCLRRSTIIPAALMVKVIIRKKAKKTNQKKPMGQKQKRGERQYMGKMLK